MFYILHHSKGALMLSAGDRDQVFKWSERQLGKRAGLFSITEGVCKEAVNSVERDGTGIGNGIDEGCHPLMGVMANLAQEVSAEHGSSKSHNTLFPVPRPGIRKETIH